MDELSWIYKVIHFTLLKKHLWEPCHYLCADFTWLTINYLLDIVWIAWNKNIILADIVLQGVLYRYRETHGQRLYSR